MCYSIKHSSQLLRMLICFILLLLWQISCTQNTSMSTQFANRDTFNEKPSNEITANWTHIIQPSIFNNVPPFIRFSYFTDTKIVLPLPVRESLIWCKTVPLANRIVQTTGLRLLPNRFCKNWIGYFNGKATRSREPKYVIEAPYQRYNRFPGSEELCNKDKLWLNAHKLIVKFGIQEFDFFFESYTYPSELFQFYQRDLHSTEYWIFKPSRSTHSAGIKVFLGFKNLPQSRHKSAIIQKYLIDAHRINGFKLRFRTYIVVTSFHPLRIYLYNDGDTNLERGMNDAGEQYARNKHVFDYWRNEGFNVTNIQAKIEDAIIKIMFIGEKKIADRCFQDLGSKYNAYQFWTADFTFDKSLQPLLMEINSYGALSYAHAEPARVKLPMFTETLNLAGYHFPPTLSTKGRTLLQKELDRLKPDHLGEVVFNPTLYSFNGSDKETQFNLLGISNRSSFVESILEELEDEDVHNLIIAEDELSRTINYRRIFPTKTTFRYLKYLESSPYHYMLQDAWERKYAENRSGGIEILNQLAANLKSESFGD